MEILHGSHNRAEHRQRFFNQFQKLVDEDLAAGKKPIVFLKGGESGSRYTSDTDLDFTQESNFFFLTGCCEPDCNVVIDPVSKKTTFFAPNLDDGWALWCGDYPLKEDYINKLGVDEVCWNEELDEYVKKTLNANKVYTLKAVPSVSQKWGIEIDSSNLYTELTKIRVVKTESEIKFQEIACEATALAHKHVMESIKPEMFEYAAAAELNYYQQKNYPDRFLSFLTIAGSGPLSSTLHYIRNTRQMKDGELFLLDAGLLIDSYCGDVTRTYPVNGKFSDRQKEIYNIVLAANEAVIKNSKPGVKWEDMHFLSEKIIAEGLLKVGILKGDLNEILEHAVQATFYPHGLGHSLGLDVHDPPNRDGSFQAINKPGVKFLRIRCTLEPGHVLTVEPGIYFNKRMIETARKNEKIAKYINFEKLDAEKWDQFGGIRIEDDIVITKEGCKVMTSQVPKKVEEIEALMAKHK